MESLVRATLTSAMAALPWCCIAPAAFALSGVAIASIGSALRSATLALLVLSVGMLGRSLYLAIVKRQGPMWVRTVVVLSTPAIGLVWAFRFGWLAL